MNGEDFNIQQLSWAGSIPFTGKPWGEQALGAHGVGILGPHTNNQVNCMVMFISDSHREKDMKAQSSQRHSAQGIYPVQAAPCEQPLCSTCSMVALMKHSGWFLLMEPKGVSMLLKPRTIHTRAFVCKLSIRLSLDSNSPRTGFQLVHPQPCHGPLQPLGSRGVCVPGLVLAGGWVCWFPIQNL